jgi:hypothetical protein
LLPMLMRLLLRGAGRTMALSGRGGKLPGDAGGELAIVAVAGVWAVHALYNNETGPPKIE